MTINKYINQNHPAGTRNNSSFLWFKKLKIVINHIFLVKSNELTKNKYIFVTLQTIVHKLILVRLKYFDFIFYKMLVISYMYLHIST